MKWSATAILCESTSMVGCIRQGGLEFYQTLVAKYVYPWRTSVYEFHTTKRRLFSLLGETSSVRLELVNIPSDTNRTKVMETNTLRSYLLLRAAIFVFGEYWRREMSLVRVWTSRATVACRYICKYIADACILMPGRRLIHHIPTRWGHALFSNCSLGRKQRCE